MLYGIIVGPGHHHVMMINAFKKQRLRFRYAVYWPSLKVFEVDDNGNETLLYQSLIYSIVSKLLWGVTSRIRFLTKQFHRDWLFILYDRLVSSYFEDCQFVIGWSQVSLYSIKRIKKKGGYFVLEHPMVHAEYWNQVIKNEYEKFPEVQSPKSIRTKRMMKRMLMEYDRADKINLLSSFAKKSFVSNGILPEKIINTPLGTDIQARTLSNRQTEKKSFIILYVGRLEILKGVQYLLEAYQSLKIAEIELWLVGALQQEFTAFLERYSGNYRLLGEKSKEELVTIYEQADLVVFPSLLDAFGLVIIESLSVGTPVIATRSSAAEDVITDESQGVIIPSADAAAIREAIIYVYKNREHKLTSSKLTGYKVEDYNRALSSNLGFTS